MTRVRLRSGHVQPVWAGHPWVFAQAIEAVDGAPGPGDIVSVVDARDQFIGKGYWSPNSAIPVRIVSRNPEDALDAASLARRIESACAWRKTLLGLPNAETNGYRLIHAEGDGLPGLIVDMYNDVAAVQLLTIGMKQRETELFAHIARVTGAKSVVEVSNEQTQRIEGFEAKTSVVRGPEISKLSFRERGFAFDIELASSQKTGFYFDQRENRALVEKHARGRRVLDAFCYVGGFSLAAARGGATQVVAMDTSAPALAVGAGVARSHGLAQQIEFMRADVKRALGELADKGELFDMVIADPPKLCPTSKHLEQGRKAYRRLNANAMRLLRPGGLLVSCSCSAAMKAPDFLRTIGMAARDVGRDATVLFMGDQGPDHPVPASFPEGRYLKCAVIRVQ